MVQYSFGNICIGFWGSEFWNVIFLPYMNLIHKQKHWIFYCFWLSINNLRFSFGKHFDNNWEMMIIFQVHKWVNYESMLEKCFVGKLKSTTPVHRRGQLNTRSLSTIHSFLICITHTCYCIKHIQIHYILFIHLVWYAYKNVYIYI